MKIHSWTGTVGYPTNSRDKTTQDKEDGQSPQYDPSGQQKNGSHSSPQDSQSQDEKPADFEETLEKVEKEITAFQSDIQVQADGLNASMTGQGPGLKVVLKDGTGTVVRQFTGEEFLRLRKASSSDGRIRGKILDRKL